jgi:hypothetical protein
MNMTSKWMMALALAAGPMAAQAQTYNLDIIMSGIQGIPSTTFAGSFNFNAGGTCFGSTAYCPAGTTPDFTHVHIGDPLSIDPPGGALAFTQVIGGGGSLSFNDTYLGTAPNSSFAYWLNFTINSPLGGPATSIGLNNIEFTTSPNVTGIWSCGGPNVLPTAGVTCPTATLTKAPEIDPASAASGLTLLLGSLMVLRGRRPRALQSK